MRLRIEISVATVLVVAALTGCGTDPREMGKGWLTCTGYFNPANTFRERALKHRAGAERIDAAPNRALKRAIDGSNARARGFDRPGWIELQTKPGIVKFGLPSRPWGLVAQATATREGGTWKASIGTCTLQESTPDRLILTLREPVSGFGDPNAHAVQVSTSHDLDACRPVRPDFEIRETRTQVTLTATYPWDAKNLRIRDADQDDCAGTGNVRSYTVSLREPLGTRAVRQGGYVPTRILESDATGNWGPGPPAFPIDSSPPGSIAF
ncbi:MAG: hypothetical protein JHC98_00265 [Thermoleophilaceae bacterium]|nr:hypothetical protein [Thermoleophilaceae bacterium]